jgi:hypothetical protein
MDANLEVRDIVAKLERGLRGIVAHWVIEDLERIRYLTSEYADNSKEEK